MPHFIQRDPVSSSQESDWDYPRPENAERVAVHTVIELAGLRIAKTRSAVRAFEASQPPSFYLPPDAILPSASEPVEASRVCEWKGHARYSDVVTGGQRCDRAAWSYPNPTSGFAMLRDHVAFYAAVMDAC